MTSRTYCGKNSALHKMHELFNFLYLNRSKWYGTHHSRTFHINWYYLNYYFEFGYHYGLLTRRVRSCKQTKDTVYEYCWNKSCDVKTDSLFSGNLF